MTANNDTAKTVLITGATSGIGLALFEQYANQGDKLIACGRNQEKLEALSSRAYKTASFDIRDPDEVALAAKELFPKSDTSLCINSKEVQSSTNINKRNLEERCEELDILILNAGDCRYIDDAQHFDGELFASVINTNLVSLGALLQYFLPKVKKGGQVVFVSSSATILPFPRSEAYGASKAGMDYLANSLRLDLVEHGIDVILVHPGFVSTPLTDKNGFSMPFILSSEQAASRIIVGIERRKKYLSFPKRLILIMKLFSFLPSSLYQSLILSQPKNNALKGKGIKSNDLKSNNGDHNA